MEVLIEGIIIVAVHNIRINIKAKQALEWLVEMDNHQNNHNFIIATILSSIISIKHQTKLIISLSLKRQMSNSFELTLIQIQLSIRIKCCNRI